MRLRSLLFVPGDRPERFAKAIASGTDAIILDLEDSVVRSKKADARAAIADHLRQPRTVPVLVRVNPLASDMVADDLAAICTYRPDGIVMPKAEGADSIKALTAAMGDTPIPILPIATETPLAIFQLGTYAAVPQHLMGLSWGAEDLPAAIGASSAREADGGYTAPYETVRALALFAAHAADTAAIETVFPDIADEVGLAAYVARARRDGFTGMLAIHPRQVPLINAGFTPAPQELEKARRIVDAFAAQPEAGALSLDGQMIDAPHLKMAQRLLQQADPATP